MQYWDGCGQVLSDDRKRAAYDKMRSVDMRVPTGGNCQGKDAFDASMAQFWKEYGHRYFYPSSSNRVVMV